jgi:hypothetical protein
VPIRLAADVQDLGAPEPYGFLEEALEGICLRQEQHQQTQSSLITPAVTRLKYMMSLGAFSLAVAVHIFQL